MEQQTHSDPKLPISDTGDLDHRIAARLKRLRADRGWSLDELAGRSGVSKASLSRIEKAEVSPTAQVLGRLCAAHGLTVSRLMHLAEGAFPPVVAAADQLVWRDPETEFERRAVSPPAQSLAGEVIVGRLGPGARLHYDASPRPGLEHHLLMLEGMLEVAVGDRVHRLGPGDCLRYQLHGPSAFFVPGETPARYVLFMV